MSILFFRDLVFSNLAVDICFRGRCLRAFTKPWERPYAWTRWGFTAFGCGPFGFMYWPKRKQEVRGNA